MESGVLISADPNSLCNLAVLGYKIERDRSTFQHSAERYILVVAFRHVSSLAASSAPHLLQWLTACSCPGEGRPLCCRATVPRGQCATGPLCCWATVPQSYHATEPLCHRVTVLPDHCAARAPCCQATVPSDHHATGPPCRFATVPLCHHAWWWSCRAEHAPSLLQEVLTEVNAETVVSRAPLNTVTPAWHLHAKSTKWKHRKNLKHRD